MLRVRIVMDIVLALSAENARPGMHCKFAIGVHRKAHAWALGKERPVLKPSVRRQVEVPVMPEAIASQEHECRKRIYTGSRVHDAES